MKPTILLYNPRSTSPGKQRLPLSLLALGAILGALGWALAYETRVRDIYRQGAEGASDAVAEQVLSILADEEQQHIDYLEQLLSEGTEG